MMMKALHFATAVTLLACKAEPSNATVARCAAQCEAASECPGVSSDCVDGCEADYELVKAIDCEAEYVAILDCVDGSTTPCDDLSGCEDAVNEFTLCYVQFCGSYPGDSSVDARTSRVEQGLELTDRSSDFWAQSFPVSVSAARASAASGPSG
jgi:hypothetical protein